MLTSVSNACSEVGHEGKCPEEIVGLGIWECGGVFHGWDGETEGKTCLGREELLWLSLTCKTCEIPPDGGAQAGSQQLSPSWPHRNSLDLLHGIA